MSDPSRPRVDNLKERLTKQSATLAERASSLSKRFELLQEWLADFPGKAAASVSEERPDEDDGVLYIGFSRFGQNWRFLFKYELCSAPPDDNWQPLASASLRLKLRAVDLLPKLMVAMLGSTEELAVSIDQANRKMDALAASLGADLKEGR